MFLRNKKIRLFWWNETRLMKKTKENYGDLLGKYLVERISGKEAVWTHPKRFSIKNYFSPIYVTIGSVLAQVNRTCIVWGSGIIGRQFHVKEATFLAVRGPQTRNFLLEKGYDVPEIYGDPAILLPDYYDSGVEKKYKTGIVPHYNDYKLVSEMYKDDDRVAVINLMTNSIEQTTDEIVQCERIISSSLHGLIVAHSYGIPALWIQYSDKLFGDGIKFRDYFESMEMPPYVIPVIEEKPTEDEIIRYFESRPVLPEKAILQRRKKELMEVCPFVTDSHKMNA